MVLYVEKTLKTTIEKKLRKSQKLARKISVVEFRYSQIIFLRFTGTLFHDDLDEKITSNEQKVTSNQQPAKSSASFLICLFKLSSITLSTLLLQQCCSFSVVLLLQYWCSWSCSQRGASIHCTGLTRHNQLKQINARKIK